MAESTAPLTGKTVLVTGGAKRLGRATALALAGQGADVVVHWRSSAAEADDLAEQIRKAGRKCWTVQADLASPDQAQALVPRAIDQAGGLDILINNAAIFPADRLTDVAVEDILVNIQIHAISPLLLSRAFAAQGRPGHIVNFLDTRITDYDRAHTAYHLSKRMLYTLTRMLALELAPQVAVNAVAPGLVLPPPGRDAGAFKKLVHTNPLNRVGSVEEVARTVLFLVGSQFVTGQVIFVDGGRHMKGRVYG